MRLFGLILSLVVVFALPFLLFGELFTVTPGGNEAVERLEAYGHWSWAMGVGLIVGDLVLPIPATAVMAAMGILYGPVGGGVLSGAASFLAGAIAFVATRRFGRGLALKLAGAEELARSERFFARAGGYAVALSRGLPVLPEVTSCLAGLSRMRRRVFYPALALGSFATGFAYAWLGYAGREQPILSMVLGAVIPVALWPLVKRLVRDDSETGAVEEANATDTSKS